MVFPCFSITIHKLVLNFFSFILSFVEDIFMVVLSSCFPLPNTAYLSEEEDTDDCAVEYRPSPSLVPVPVHFIVESIQERLPVIQYICMLQSLGTGKVNSDCAVCLKSLKANDEVRELQNCTHAFHKECLDAWIKQGQLTCPLCRSKVVLPDQGEKLKCGEDPWRRERVTYLFGEDYVMGTS